MARQAKSPTANGLLNTAPFWRSDIDALMFPIEAHSASCVVHRRAFRTLLRSEPTPQDCLRYFARVEHAFRSAANAKIAQKNIPIGMNFHLTSRDITRKLVT
jgi:hypothetical protein